MRGRGSPSDQVFRVLALDGGGIRGIFTASFLSTVEDLAQARVGEFFDLIVGTSTGGIIALALAFRIPARRVLDYYLTRGSVIFACRRGLSALLRPKREVFGERALDEVETPVCIPSYELTTSYPRIWKDDHAPDMSWWGDQPAWKVALATAAAPAYFPGASVIPGDSHVDGGLFANNPTLVGLTEAVRYFHQPLEQIRILSIGAGERAERIPHERARRMGLWQWKTALYDHMLIAQARIVHEITGRLLARGQYERVNIPLEHSYPLDDYRAARALLEPGAQQARTRFHDLQELFLFARATAGREQKAAVAAR
jgi:patatin-like phospholipase/acyl hydrolase